MKNLVISSILCVLPLTSSIAQVSNTQQDKALTAQSSNLNTAETLYKQKDFKQAFNAYQIEAKKGDGKATYNLAVMYEKGEGVTKSNKKAIEHYEKSAAQGFQLANFALAKAYLAGSHDLKKDNVKFKNHLTLASNAGLPIAQYWLAQTLLTENKPESTQVAVALLESLSAKKSKEATHILALVNLNTNKYAKADKNKAIALLEANASQGYIHSIATLADMNWKGVVLQKNLKNAESYYKVLADNKVPKAAENLAMIQKEMTQAKK